MKKTFAAAAAAMMMLSCAGMSTFAAGSSLSADVYVTISDGSGKLPLAMQKVAVTDIDDDMKITVNDVLYCAHEQYYKDGTAGYHTGVGSYGMYLDMLWGIENGMSFGYYVNNKPAFGLTDDVETGSYVSAFVYTDTTTWSDTYSFFDANTVSAETGTPFDMTLSLYTYVNYEGVSVPAANAIILINGEETEYITDDEGKVSITFDTPGKNVISAKSGDSGRIIVPPAAIVNVKESQETTSSGEVTSTTTATSSNETVSDTKTTTTAASSGVKGDADGNGKVSVSDIVCVLQYAANKAKYPLSDPGFKNADVDEDGDVTTKDAFLIQEIDSQQG